jgi:hypothetical protein
MIPKYLSKFRADRVIIEYPVIRCTANIARTLTVQFASPSKQQNPNLKFIKTFFVKA